MTKEASTTIFEYVITGISDITYFVSTNRILEVSTDQKGYTYVDSLSYLPVRY